MMKNLQYIPAQTPLQVDPVSTVEAVVTRALEASADRMGLGNANAMISCMKGGDSVAFNYYCYNIAKQLGEVLGSLSKEIRVVYAYDYEGAASEETCFESASLFPLVHIIIWAGRQTKALDALIETIDRAMVQHHRHMLGLTKLEHVIDVQVIDDEDVKSRAGYAALLKSIYQPPIQVWRSDFGGL